MNCEVICNIISDSQLIRLKQYLNSTDLPTKFHTSRGHFHLKLSDLYLWRIEKCTIMC